MRRCNERAEFAQRKRDTMLQRSTIRKVSAPMGGPLSAIGCAVLKSALRGMVALRAPRCAANRR